MFFLRRTGALWSVGRNRWLNTRRVGACVPRQGDNPCLVHSRGKTSPEWFCSLGGCQWPIVDDLLMTEGKFFKKGFVFVLFLMGDCFFVYFIRQIDDTEWKDIKAVIYLAKNYENIILVIWKEKHRFIYLILYCVHE